MLWTTIFACQPQMEQASRMLPPLCVTAQMSCQVWLLILSCSLRIYPTVSELVFLTLPEDGAGVLNRPLTLHCEVYDSSLQRILPVKWERDTGGPKLKIDSRVHQMANGSLFFPHLQEEDLGTYVCNAKNGRDQIRTAVRVYKADLEAVFFSPQSQVVREGQKVFLQCVSGDSSPPAQISWWKDGRPLTKGTQIQGQYGGGNQKKTSGTLHLENISKEDEGVYVCVTYNPLLNIREESSAATLTVQGSTMGLEIIQGPVNITVAIETEAVLRCAVRGFPLPMVQWFKDDQPLHNTSRWSLHDDGQLLVFKKVLEEDEGSYYCEAKNEKETVRSQPAFLLPAVMEWTFARQPANMTVRIGDSVTLACRPPRSRPTARVSWFKNNRLLSPLPQFPLELQGDLLFHSVQETDRGVYFCRATNAHLQRDVTSRKVYLEVQTPPAVTISPALVTVPVGSGVVIQCQVSGHPVPSIEWSKQGRSVHTGGKVTVGLRNATLYISSVRSYDEGLYTCKASNSVGQDQRTASLRVAVSPIIVSSVVSMSSSEGATVNLPCRAVGDAPIKYTWSRGVLPTPLSPSPQMHIDDKGTLHISNVQRSDSGEYHCNAENRVGHDQRIIILTVSAEDVPPDKDKLLKGNLSAVTTKESEQITSPNPNSNSNISNDSERIGIDVQLPVNNSLVDVLLKNSPTHPITVSAPDTLYTPTPLNDPDSRRTGETEPYRERIRTVRPSNLLSQIQDVHTQPLDPDSHLPNPQTQPPGLLIQPPKLFTQHPRLFTEPVLLTQPPSLLAQPVHPDSLPADPHTRPPNLQTQPLDLHNQPPNAHTQPQQYPPDSQFPGSYSLSPDDQTPTPHFTASDIGNISSSIPEQTQQNWSQPVDPAGPTKSAKVNNADLTEWLKKNTSQSPMRTTDDNASTPDSTIQLIIKPESASWLPVLEKHDIPIVVGVGVSLAFIFITMAFYSLVQKDPAAPPGRGALRNLGAPCRHAERLATGRTYANRAFEDDNCVAVIEQSPNTSETRAHPPAPSPSTLMIEPSYDDTQEEVPSSQDLPVIVETHPEPGEEEQIETSLEDGKATQSPQPDIQLQCVEDWRGGEFGQCQDAPSPPPPSPPPTREEGLRSSLTLQTTEPSTTPVHHSVNISHGNTPLLLSHSVSLGMTTVAVDVHFYPSASAAAAHPHHAAPGPQGGSRQAQSQACEQGHHSK